MKNINDTLLNFNEGADILAKGVIIAEKKKTNPKLINATLGTLFDENKKIAVLPLVKETVKNLKDEELFPYTATQGPATFENNLISFLFDKYENDIRKSKYLKVIPTPGATGAISTSLFMCLNQKETVIIPSLCWGVYFNMCKTMNLKYVEYDYIKDNHFNIEGFKKAVEEVSKYQKHIVTILNDPCNNPTSYSLSDEEFDELIDYMNSRKDITFTLIYDVAYYEYSYEDSRKRFSMLKKFDDNVLTILAWSASKAFTIYGLRLGAMVFIDNDKEKVDKISSLARSCSRTRWSCVSSVGINTVNKIISSKESMNRLHQEVKQFNDMLYKRVEIFEKEAKEVGLNMIPYKGGFFVAVPCSNIDETVRKLEEHDIYLTTNKNVLRIAICGLSLEETKGLAKIVKECL